LVRGQRWWIGIGVVVLWYAAREVRVDDMLFVQKSVVLLYLVWLILDTRLAEFRYLYCKVSCEFLENACELAHSNSFPLAVRPTRQSLESLLVTQAI